VTVTDDDAWLSLATVLARPDLAKNERLAGVDGRQAAHDELDDAIEAWAATVTAQEGFHRLQRAGVAAAPHLDERGFASDPQVAAREWIRPLTTRDVGTYPHLGQAFRGIPLAWDRGAPSLGEDNEYVFQRILGLDDAEYQRLVAEGVAVEDYLDSEGNPY
jgi:crotonobetainyl-CoA:carnitine CoA-transferase CaiB-like acyl-CoA transferase